MARVHKKFKEMDDAIKDLREWITSTVEILRVLSTDDATIEESMKNVEVQTYIYRFFVLWTLNILIYKVTLI